MGESLYEEMQRMMDDILRVRYYDLNWEQELCVTLLGMAEREKYTYGIAFACTYLGDYYIGYDDSARAGLMLERAREMCLKNGFQDLMPRIYNLLGIFYTTIADEQSAMNSYLDALDLPILDQDPGMKCTLFNNVAYTFASHRDFEEAKRYYAKSFELTEQSLEDHPQRSYFLLRMWVNLSESHCGLMELDECRACLEQGELVESYEDNAREYLLCRGWSHYYAAVGDVDGLAEKAQRLLETPMPEGAEHYFIYEALAAVCRGNIDAGNQEYAQALIVRIDALDTEAGGGHVREIRSLWVRYNESFGTEAEQSESYRDFYYATHRDEETSSQMRASGIKATLNLRQALKDKECAVREKAELEKESHLDELTRLYNRRYLNKLVSKSVADRGLRTLGLIMVDVDYFKEYNDTYGHAAGDGVLCAVANLLREHGGERIYPARYGGDEFTCLCPGLENSEIEHYIQSVQEGLEALNIPHVNSRCAQRLTLSMGYTNHAEPATLRSGTLLEAADAALYRVKEAGRNGWAGPEV